jgi:hypothetical protein
MEGGDGSDAVGCTVPGELIGKAVRRAGWEAHERIDDEHAGGDQAGAVAGEQQRSR